MPVDPAKISIWTLLVALFVLVFGDGILIRSWTALQAYSRNRVAREKQLLEYLRHATVFLDGLPLFIT